MTNEEKKAKDSICCGEEVIAGEKRENDCPRRCLLLQEKNKEKHKNWNNIQHEHPDSQVDCGGVKKEKRK